MAKQRVVVGLSGGVDSAVTAHLLKQQGYEVIGIFMKNWEDDDDPPVRATTTPVTARRTSTSSMPRPWPTCWASRSNTSTLPPNTKTACSPNSCASTPAGRTPNPDVLCNAEIKFKAFLDHAMRLGAEMIATGHYARVRLNDKTGKHELLKGLDPSKDQSYFLHRLNQAQLARTLFPVGELHKTEVRRIAAGDRPAQCEEERLHRHLLHR